MNKRIKELAEQAGFMDAWFSESGDDCEEQIKKFAELIVQECLKKIETYEIPVGNSYSGELACEWTYDALKSIRNDIKEHLGVNDEITISNDL
jgi:hypothetical protein